MSRQSLQAHEAIKPFQSTFKARVANLIHSGALTLDEVKKRLNLKHQTASSILSILFDEGVVFQDVSGRYHHTPEDRVQDIVHLREVEKFNKWRKKGEENGWFLQKWGEEMETIKQ